MGLFYAGGRLNSVTITARKVSPHFQSRNHSSWKFRVQLPILQSATITITADGSFTCSYPRPPIARAMRLRVLLDATWLLQQGIRIHRFPLSCLSSSPRPLVQSSHRLHNRFSSPCECMYKWKGKGTGHRD